MSFRNRIFLLIILIFQGLSFSSCLKDNKTLQVVTDEITEITETHAKGGGNVVSDGGSPVLSRGLVWSSSVIPTLEENEGKTLDGSGVGSFESSITGLEAQKIYYVRAYATNEKGVAYGSAVSFQANYFAQGDGVTDVEGNFYKTTRIGSQEWMGRSLRVTKYADGSAIEGVYVVEEKDEWNGPYGRLYTWNAAMKNQAADGSMNQIVQGACPDNWRLPNENDWKSLEQYLGMTEAQYVQFGWRGTKEGGNLKSKNQGEDEHPRWLSPNEGATNISLFEAVPAGTYIDGKYAGFGFQANFWTATAHDSERALNRGLHRSRTRIWRSADPIAHAYSIRCIKE